VSARIRSVDGSDKSVINPELAVFTGRCYVHITKIKTMATNQPDGGTPESARNVMFIMSTDPTKLADPVPNSRSIFVCHLPHEVDEEGNVTFLRNGNWVPAGECSNNECGDLGPAYFHCVRCDPLGFVYVPVSETDRKIVYDDPRSEGHMAHLVHSNILAEPDPAAARVEFLLFLESCFLEVDKPFWDKDCPRTRTSQEEASIGHHKLATAARLIHATILEEPDPAASRSHFLMLLDSYWADYNSPFP
jgi:hypothetical protein